MQNRWTQRVTAFAATFVAVFVVSAPAHAAPREVNDPYVDRLWYLGHLGVPEAWNSSLGLETVPVAIIDTGVDLDHPDLVDNIWRNYGEIPGDGIDNDGNGYVDDVFGWDFVDDDADPNPERNGTGGVGASHGTVSAGIVSAKGDNGLGIVGVTWQAPIMALRALDENGIGDPVKVARAVDYAVDNGAKVINLSFAGSARSARLAAALRRAYDKGVFVVAAAGNAPDGVNGIDLDVDQQYPVCFDLGADENFVYGVAATDEHDVRASFSNYGAGCVDGSAPGTHVISTQLYDPEDPRFNAAYGGYFEGTSVAAPMVAGTAALMRALDPTLTPKRITNILTETATRIDDLNPGYFGKLGRGRIDTAKAVALVANEGRPKTLPPPALVTSTLLPAGDDSLIVTAPGKGRDAEVRMFTSDGVFVRGFDAFPKGYAGGVSLAVGNFDGASRSSIVAGALGGGAPQVRIFDVNTRNIGGFLAYDERFHGGVEVATGDLTGDGIDEIVTGAGPGGGPHVRVFDKHGKEISGFFAFEESYRGGIDVAVGDLDGDGTAEIVVADARGTVRTFDLHGNRLEAFVPIEVGATRLAVDVADVDGDGKGEVIVRPYDGGGIRHAYSARGQHLGELSSSGGLSAAAAMHGVAFGSAPGGAPIAHATDPSGFLAYEPGFTGGIRAAVIELSR